MQNFADTLEAIALSERLGNMGFVAGECPVVKGSIAINGQPEASPRRVVELLLTQWEKPDFTFVPDDSERSKPYHLYLMGATRVPSRGFLNWRLEASSWPQPAGGVLTELGFIEVDPRNGLISSVFFQQVQDNPKPSGHLIKQV